MSILSVSNVSYRYPNNQALSDISFKLKKQSITALIGPNGAGKTTLLRCIAALQPLFLGSIELNGKDIQDNPRAAHSALGYLADDFGLYKDLTVRQCLEHAAGIQMIRGDANTKAVDDVIKRLNLKEYENAKTKTLSRGWRQRVGIGTAIIHKPKLLLLDEPASGLDPDARNELSKLMNQLKKEGMTLLVSSHILAELEAYCEDMIILKNGKLVKEKAKAKASHTTLMLELLEDSKAYLDTLEKEKKISNINAKGKKVVFNWSGNETDQTALLKRLLKKNVPVKGLNELSESMQDRYFKSLKGDKS